MTPTLLHQFWSLIENTQASIILNQDDPSLVDWLITQMKHQQPLAVEECDRMNSYIRSKTTLIRDIVAERHSGAFC